MSDRSSIEWTDATWNPVTGCTKVSPGCDNCYALTLAERFRGTRGHYFENGFDVQLRPDKLARPIRWKKPRRIFVNSMSDLFHDQVPDEYIAQVFAVMALAEQHTFQVLTKRHSRMRSVLNSPQFWDQVSDQAWPLARVHHIDATWPARATDPRRGPLRNVWLGVSVENQKWADIRGSALRETPAAVRFFSAEPLLGPVVTDLSGIDWVIVGGESGRGARPMHPDWARSLRDQCEASGVPFLFKQWGDGSLWIDRQGDVWTPGVGELMHTPETAPFSREHVERKWGPLKALGKHAAGRELDGRTWDEFPQAVS